MGNRRTIRKPMPMQVYSHQSLHKIQIHLEGEEVYYQHTNTMPKHRKIISFECMTHKVWAVFKSQKVEER